MDLVVLIVVIDLMDLIHKAYHNCDYSEYMDQMKKDMTFFYSLYMRDFKIIRGQILNKLNIIQSINTNLK